MVFWDRYRSTYRKPLTKITESGEDGVQLESMIFYIHTSISLEKITHFSCGYLPMNLSLSLSHMSCWQLGISNQ